MQKLAEFSTVNQNLNTSKLQENVDIKKKEELNCLLNKVLEFPLRWGADISLDASRINIPHSQHNISPLAHKYQNLSLEESRNKQRFLELFNEVTLEPSLNAQSISAALGEVKERRLFSRENLEGGSESEGANDEKEGKQQAKMSLLHSAFRPASLNMEVSSHVSTQSLIADDLAEKVRALHSRRGKDIILKSSRGPAGIEGQKDVLAHNLDSTALYKNKSLTQLGNKLRAKSSNASQKMNLLKQETNLLTQYSKIERPQQNLATASLFKKQNLDFGEDQVFREEHFAVTPQIGIDGKSNQELAEIQTRYNQTWKIGQLIEGAKFELPSILSIRMLDFKQEKELNVKNILDNCLQRAMEKGIVEKLDRYLAHLFAEHNKKFNASPEILFQKCLTDLNLPLFIQYFLPKKQIVDSTIKQFLTIKEKHFAHEAHFLKNIFQYMTNFSNCCIELCKRMSICKAEVTKSSEEMLENIDTFGKGMHSLKELNETVNKELNLYGISKLSQHDFIKLFTHSKQNLQTSGNEAGKKLFKILQEYEVFLKDLSRINSELKNSKAILKKEMKEKTLEIDDFREATLEDKTQISKMLKECQEKLAESNIEKEMSLEKMYKEKTNTLEAEIEKLRNEKEELRHNLKEKKEECKELDRDLKLLINKKRENVGIQCVVDNQTLLERYHVIFRPPKHKKHFNMVYEEVYMNNVGYVQSLEWAQHIITNIYIDKYFADAEDISEGRICKGMRSYVIEWFLSKFGIRKYADAFLKDFVRTILEYEKRHFRFQGFIQILGLHFFYGGRDITDYLKSALMASTDTQFLLVKLMYKLRKGVYPFLPNISVTSDEGKKQTEDWSSFLHSEKAKSVFYTLMGTLGFNSDQFKDFDRKVRLLLFDEKFIQAKKQQVGGAGKLPSEIDKLIRYDEFIQLAITEYNNVKLQRIDPLSTSLEVAIQNSENSYDITYEEYQNAIRRVQSKRSTRWIEQSYHFLIENMPTSINSPTEMAAIIAPWVADTYGLPFYVNQQNMQKEEETKAIAEGATFKLKKQMFKSPMRDPISNAFLLDNTMKIMKNILGPIEHQKNLMSKSINLVKKDLSHCISQMISGEFDYHAKEDPTIALWKNFRKTLGMVSKKHSIPVTTIPHLKKY